VAKADCGLCEAMGYRACDRCGNVVMNPPESGPELCAYCLDDDLKKTASH
jgi:RNA polymerase subunit RPABC4/transcription elongation factor Spt4